MTAYGKASNELFMQFISRVAQEIPTATVAIFSKLKYITAPTLEDFRRIWNAQYLGGFVVDSKSFDGLKGSFPIGFLIWETDMVAKQKIPITQITTDVLDKNVSPVGERTFYNLPITEHLNSWLPRIKTDTIHLPLTNAIHPQLGKAKVSAWVKKAIGSLALRLE
jgi:hypothetical protein